jgi:hypothetical protein
MRNTGRRAEAGAGPQPSLDELRGDRSRLLLAAALAAPLAALAWALPALLPGPLRDLAEGAALGLPAALLLSALEVRRARSSPLPVDAAGGPPAAEGSGVAPVIRLHPRQAPPGAGP